MKKIVSIIGAPLLILLVAILSSGCGKKEPATTTPTSTPTSTATAKKSPAIVSVGKTSFNEVTSQLDPGGNFYLYLDTAQWLNGVSSKVSTLKKAFTSMPNLDDSDRHEMNQAFDVITHLIQDSGIEDVNGVGMSSIEVEKGLYRNKMLVYHYPGKGSGFLWNLSGKQPHPLTGLDMLPANTAMATFSDLDLPLVWATLQQEVTQADLPQAQAWLQKIPADFEQKTQIKWNQFLDSLGGEFGFIVTFDESNQIPIPLPTSEPLKIPEPGLLIVVKVNDDTIFNRIDQALKKNPQVTSVNQGGVKMRTMPLPIPLPIELRPTIATSDGYLFIGSSDTIINEALAVKDGKKPGLKSTDEFKRLSRNIPQTGNQFTFISKRFGQTMFRIQKQALAMNAKMSSTQNQWMQSFMRPDQAAFAYTVAANTTDGWMTIGNGNQSAAKMVLLPAMVVPGILAAIAIPNFVKARETAQKNACINNLREIEAAKQQWALEHNKKTTDTPTWDDLKPYLRGPVPLHCPAGGTYTINEVGKRPTCSIPGHQLP
jgi:hypothetical protein